MMGGKYYQRQWNLKQWQDINLKTKKVYYEIQDIYSMERERERDEKEDFFYIAVIQNKSEYKDQQSGNKNLFM